MTLVTTTSPVTRNLFLGFLMALILEGAVGKWIIPLAGDVLVLIRDVLAILIINDAVRKNNFYKLGAAFEIVISWTFLVIIWGMLQLMINQTPPIIFAIGVRFWLLYLWMALAVGVSLDGDDVEFILKALQYALLAMTPLVVAQHLSPPGHILNFQLNTEEDKIFRVAGNVVRTSGTFSFTLGFTCFLAIVSPVIFSGSHIKNAVNNKSIFYLIMPLALLICTIVSGSRAAIIFYGVLFFLNSLMQLANSKNGENVFSAIKILASVSLTVIVLATLNTATEATFTRFEEASDSEVFSDRVVTIFIGEPEVRAAFTFLGAGIGAGTNAGGVISTGNRAFQLAESEPGRISLEAGILGHIYTLLKISLVVIGVRSAWKIYIIRGEALPFLMWISTAIGLLMWPVSGQLSSHGFGFAMVGISLALILQVK